MRIFEIVDRNIREIELNDRVDFDAFLQCARARALKVYETEIEMKYFYARAAVIVCSRIKKIVCVVDTDTVDENIILYIKFLISLFTPINT